MSIMKVFAALMPLFNDAECGEKLAAEVQDVFAAIAETRARMERIEAQLSAIGNHLTATSLYNDKAAAQAITQYDLQDYNYNKRANAVHVEPMPHAEK